MLLMNQHNIFFIIYFAVSGLSGTRETAQQQVLIGMGLLAGFTIMLMAVLWGSCLVVGKVGLSESSSPSQHSWIGKVYCRCCHHLSVIFIERLV